MAIEVFSSDLPSPCNVYLSGKRSSASSSSSSPPPQSLRFASERHSLTLLRRGSRQGDHDRAAAGRTITARGGDDYSLFVGRLPETEEDGGRSSSSYGAKRRSAAAESKKSVGDLRNRDVVCLAHSSASWEEDDDTKTDGRYRADFAVDGDREVVAASSSPRRVRFEFGDGRDSSEREVVVAWSSFSEVQTIHMDGEEVFSKGDDDGDETNDDPPEAKTELRHSWRDEGTGMSLEVIVHRATPASEGAGPTDPDDRRRCDLMIDGTSFFDLPEASELGNRHLESSLEVFAMTGICPPSGGAEKRDVKEQKTSSSDSNSLVTHGSHSLSEGGKDGGGDGVAVAEAATTRAASEGDAGKGDKERHGGGAATNYYLTVKRRVLPRSARAGEEGKREKTRTHVQTIPLDFRPMSVLAAELHLSADSETDVNDGLARRSAVGVFVASADDNVLRLYSATRGASRDDGDTDGGPRFVPVPLRDAGALDDDVLALSSPITAMDACVADDEEEEERAGTKGRSRANRVAVACYDGTVRILTYQLELRGRGDSKGPSIRFRPSRSSSFVVDGPVASLSFGIPPPNIPRGRSPLFLVAGSLCGFACAFYESFSSSGGGAEGDGRSRRFEGPFLVVDGLYDARGEGYEDCVTSVHACRGVGGRAAIAVGTQGGRVLMFQQLRREGEKNSREEREGLAEREKDELASRVDENEKEMSRLRSKKEEMNNEARALKEVISDMQRKIEESATESHAPNAESLQIGSLPESDDTAEDEEGPGELSSMARGKDAAEPTVGEMPNFETKLATEVVTLNADSLRLSSSSEGLDTINDAEDEEGSDKPIPRTSGKEEADPTQDIDEAPSFETKLEAARAELLLLERKISDHESAIGVLTSAAAELARRRSSAGGTEDPGGDDSILAAREARTTRRHELLWERRLPYPIHGIASSAQAGEDGGRDLFVSTRRSFHVLRCYFADVGTIGESVELLEENLSRLLAT